MTTTLVRPRTTRPAAPPPRPSRPRLLLVAILAGAVLAAPLVLRGGHLGPFAPAAAPAVPTTANPTAAEPTAADPTAYRADPLAAGRALAARPAPGAFDSAVGDFASHFDDSGGGGLVDGAPRPRVVAGPGMQFSLPGGGKRAEVLPLVPEYHEGDDLWVRDVSHLRGLPTGTDSWQVVLQWHQRANTGSPPIALEAGHGRLRLANVGTDQQDLGPLGPDDTLDVVLHVHFSRSPSRALVEVWRDGRPRLQGYHPPAGTLLDDGSYLKLGLYRDPDIAQPSSMTTTRLVAGPTAASINATGITPRR